MAGITYYRDAALPFFQLKICDAEHLSYFTKTFRSHVGVTPEAYQKAHR